ncbi:hypothetical protein ACRCPT_06775 [Pseudomonas aeruginosa]|jgi:hypothetical protein|uniref:hypothetical protein n=1 Tax=Pseudomonadaceae TaxID=135621 RepID=UPI0028678CAE|nr:hypothetical protein [Pseudomonas guguanensis]MDR8015297.1 hypothetical protein [Pseudomonas guguanensis]
MATTATAKLNFDDSSASIQSTAAGFILRDEAGNEVGISLRAVLRCLAVAEKEKRVPSLPVNFWSDPAVQAKR